MSLALNMTPKVIPFKRRNKETYELTTPDLYRAFGQLEGTAKMMQEGLVQVTKSQAEMNIGLTRMEGKLDSATVSQAQTHAIALDALKQGQRANNRIDLISAKAMGAGMVGSTVIVGVGWLIEHFIFGG